MRLAYSYNERDCGYFWSGGLAGEEERGGEEWYCLSDSNIIAITYFIFSGEATKKGDRSIYVCSPSAGAIIVHPNGQW